MSILHPASGQIHDSAGLLEKAKLPASPGRSERRTVQTLRTLLRWLPHRLRRAVVREAALTLKGDFATIQALARCADVVDTSIMGAYGLIQGSVEDSAVLGTYCRTKTWRPAFAEFFNGFFGNQERGVFIDVGANIGLTIIPVVRDAHIRCFGFEPDPTNFRYLRNNVQLNCPDGNVRLFDLALFDAAGILDLQLSESNKGDHRLHRDPADGVPGEQQRQVIRVPTARLDDVLLPCLGDDDAPLAAKIVAQGAETHIVAGGLSVLSRASALVIEVYPYAIERLDGNLSELLCFCTRQFASGALNSCEQDDVLDWRPVSVVANQLRDRYLTASRNECEYFHLFLRR